MQGSDLYSHVIDVLIVFQESKLEILVSSDIHRVDVGSTLLDH